MNRWTYYSPLLIGLVVAVILYRTYMDYLPPMPQWLAVATAVGFCLLFAIYCQLIMVGAQGVLAQALPVPGGRTVRGRGAVTGGAFLLGWPALGFVAALLGVEGLRTAALVIAIASAVCLVGFVITYAWQWPAAQRDFAEERLGAARE